MSYYGNCSAMLNNPATPYNAITPGTPVRAYNPIDCAERRSIWLGVPGAPCRRRYNNITGYNNNVGANVVNGSANCVNGSIASVTGLGLGTAYANNGLYQQQQQQQGGRRWLASCRRR